MKTNKIHLAHLGCSKNMVDSEIHLSHFYKLGFEETQIPNEADIILVNTCGFIEEAKEQSILTIFEHASAEDKAKVVVTGCLYQRYENLDKEMPEVDGWLKSNTLEDVEELVQKMGFQTRTPNYQSSPFDRILLEKTCHAYLRISEGCNKSCAFCSIPGFKGKMVSRTIESLVEESKKLILLGVKEINIVSQDTANYGIDIYDSNRGEVHLLKLLQELEKLDIFRIRVHYLYPLMMSDSFYQYIAQSKKVCHYIDMPIQHCNKELLAKMKRPGNYQKYIEEIKRMKTIIPDLSLRSSFIVGFPTETEEQFIELKNFVKEAQFDWVGVFTYSHEEDTNAFQYKNTVHYRTKRRRKRELMECYYETKENMPSKVGQTIKVLLEEKSGETWLGRSQYQATEVDGLIYIDVKNGTTGQIVEATIIEEIDVDQKAKFIRTISI
ncbi:MAG: 30S ribosomal protein S12 methylthiotransferase RimO [Candidatus Cloacimonadota bacterium]|nr:MAG: 30S ribosomal protein S12 methylthiotransferase RimO [Candidatus Cloacimonadota bacterium]